MTRHASVNTYVDIVLSEMIGHSNNAAHMYKISARAT